MQNFEGAGTCRLKSITKTNNFFYRPPPKQGEKQGEGQIFIIDKPTFLRSVPAQILIAPKVVDSGDA